MTMSAKAENHLHTGHISNAIAMQGMTKDERQEKWESKQIYCDMPYWYWSFIWIYFPFDTFTRIRALEIVCTQTKRVQAN